MRDEEIAHSEKGGGRAESRKIYGCRNITHKQGGRLWRNRNKCEGEYTGVEGGDK
jgi:hypothetical protein